MSKVFLRVYNREIESMIEGGQLDEAVAHCQYILKTFPMHVDTYRLLGKTFLEARRYADAADIFQRVLMAVPDDFVSHVGMSIIRDDENKMDDSIWHMERAFEVQPSNSAIQGELRRLYGRRDGVEPSKIRLSRDALANMYSQGELFNQAIAEIRSVLAEDTNRPDLQVMLARAYYRSGQKVEAAEMAAALLKKYPYCMDALRVLVDVLPGTARAENTQVYRQRLHNLDPYSSFTVNSAFASDQVVDSAVNLERLEYKSGATPVSSQPDWAASLGIKLDDGKHSDTPPTWMQIEEAPAQLPASTVAPADSLVAPAPVGESESVPEWMRSAGWQKADKEAQVSSTDSEESPPDEPIAKADIPDWLKSMAPTDAPEQVSPEPEPEEPAESLPVGVDGIPDWLKPTGSLGAAKRTQLEDQQPVEPHPASASDVPDWLKSMAPAEVAAEIHVDVPSQPSEPQQETGKSQPANEDEAADWLKTLTPAKSADEANVETPVPLIDTQPVTVEPAPQSADDVSDWLKSIAPAGAVDDVPEETPLKPSESQQMPVEPGPANADDVPDWLKSLAPSETVGEAPAESQQPGGVDELPAKAPQPPVEPQTIGVDANPDWLKPLAPAEAYGGVNIEASKTAVEPQPESASAIPDWLKSMAPADDAADQNVMAEPASEETASKEPETGSMPAEPTSAKVESFPDWSAGIGSRASAAAMAAKAMEQPVANQPVPAIPVPPGPSAQAPIQPQVPPAPTGETFHPTGEVKPLNIGDDAFSWLESLAAKQGAKPEELLSNPEERSGEMPDWLRQPGEKPVDVPLSAAQETVNTPPETIPFEQNSLIHASTASKPAHSIDEAFPVKDEKSSSVPPAETMAQPANQPLSGEDDTMAWLEQMATNQGAKPEEPLAGTPPEEISPATPEPAPVEEDISITSWLSKLDVDEEVEKKSGEVPSTAAPATPADELPDWLKGIEKPVAEVEAPEAEAPETEAPKTNNDLPAWLSQPIPSETAEPTPSSPVVGSSQEPDLPAWVDENVSAAGQAVPTMPEEWLPAETKTDAMPDSLPLAEPALTAETTPQPASMETRVSTPVPKVNEAIPTVETPPVAEPILPAESTPISVPTTVQKPILKQTGMLSHIPAQDKDAELLLSAQNVLDQNSLDDAMKKYAKLIKKGRLLDEVIHDLREAIYRYPVDVIVWQTMGDAYMRANRLQDALDAYTKAEELLR